MINLNMGSKHNQAKLDLVDSLVNFGKIPTWQASSWHALGLIRTTLSLSESQDRGEQAQ